MVKLISDHLSGYRALCHLDIGPDIFGKLSFQNVAHIHVQKSMSIIGLNGCTNLIEI